MRISVDLRLRVPRPRAGNCDVCECPLTSRPSLPVAAWQGRAGSFYNTDRFQELQAEYTVKDRCTVAWQPLGRGQCRSMLSRDLRDPDADLRYQEALDSVTGTNPDGQLEKADAASPFVRAVLIELS